VENYYKNNDKPFKPSPFAEFVLSYIEKEKKLIELGCGNGRDSIYFAEQKDINILALDQAEAEIDFLNRNFNYDNLIFSSEDFTDLSIVEKFDYVYSRFTFHYISEEQENNVLKWIKSNLNKDGLFFIEARSIKDDLYRQGIQISATENITDHYRRYMNLDLFIEKLKEVNLEVIYSVDSKDIAVHKGENSIIIRIIAKKI
jgi:cyclopropane fatty-acyl-phospholipid synthase-like methyltransferase